MIQPHPVINNLLIDMNAAAGSCENDVSPEDIVAIEKVLQHIDYQNFKKAVLGPLANWLLALKIFREMELRYVCMGDRSKLVDSHRAVLTNIMSAGEGLLLTCKSLRDEDLKNIPITKAALEANLSYIRMKYQQWYSTKDKVAIGATLRAIEGRDSISKGHDTTTGS